MNHLSKFIFIFLAISPFSHQIANFTVEMSSDQYIWQFAAHIAENNMKKCYVLPGRDQNACRNYCLFYYDYIPALPYKNAQFYNPATKQCQSKIFCPPQLLIKYDQQKKICIDIIMGVTVPPVDAPKPIYKTTLNVTIICQHGKIITFLGRLDCECQLGWGSEHIPNFGSTTAFKKCNIPLGVAAYFPNFKKIYYDESYDNKFPSPAQNDYWLLLMLYYIRSLKYSIITFFFPYEVQIILLAIPAQPTLNERDWIILYWIIIFFFILCLITSFQKCSQEIETL